MSLVSDNCVFKPATRSLATFVRSLAPLTPLTRYTALRFAVLRSLCLLAPFTGSLTHFAHSLVGQLKFLNMCSRCKRVSKEQTRFWRSLETRPLFATVYLMGRYSLTASLCGRPVFLSPQKATTKLTHILTGKPVAISPQSTPLE